MGSMSRRIVVTGTNTGVGKTVFSAGLAHLIGANYWKPIQAGLEGHTDAELVATLGDLSADRILPELYRLRTPASPITPRRSTAFVSTWMRSIFRKRVSGRS